MLCLPGGSLVPAAARRRARLARTGNGAACVGEARPQDGGGQKGGGGATRGWPRAQREKRDLRGEKADISGCIRFGTVETRRKRWMLLLLENTACKCNPRPQNLARAHTRRPLVCASASTRGHTDTAGGHTARHCVCVFRNAQMHTFEAHRKKGAYTRDASRPATSSRRRRRRRLHAARQCDGPKKPTIEPLHVSS